MMYEIEIHLAASGNVRQAGRTFPARDYLAILARLEAAAATRGGSVAHAHHERQGASAEFVVEIPTWDRSDILAIARGLFTQTAMRGSLIGRLDGESFFQFACTAAGVTWDEKAVPAPKTTGQEARP